MISHAQTSEAAGCAALQSELASLGVTAACEPTGGDCWAVRVPLPLTLFMGPDADQDVSGIWLTANFAEGYAFQIRDGDGTVLVSNTWQDRHYSPRFAALRVMDLLAGLGVENPTVSDVGARPEGACTPRPSASPPAVGCPVPPFDPLSEEYREEFAAAAFREALWLDGVTGELPPGEEPAPWREMEQYEVEQLDDSCRETFVDRCRAFISEAAGDLVAIGPEEAGALFWRAAKHKRQLGNANYLSGALLASAAGQTVIERAQRYNFGDVVRLDQFLFSIGCV